MTIAPIVYPTSDESPTQEMADLAPPQDEPMSDEELAEMFRYLEADKGRVNCHE